MQKIVRIQERRVFAVYTQTRQFGPNISQFEEKELVMPPKNERIQATFSFFSSMWLNCCHLSLRPDGISLPQTMSVGWLSFV